MATKPAPEPCAGCEALRTECEALRTQLASAAAFLDGSLSHVASLNYLLQRAITRLDPILAKAEKREEPTS